MAKSRPDRPRPRRGAALSRRRRRRLARTAGILVGTAIAAGGGRLFAAGRPPSNPPAPAAAVAGSPAVPPELRLTPGAADPRVADGRLEVPVVDFSELLPTCHN